MLSSSLDGAQCLRGNMFYCIKKPEHQGCAWDWAAHTAVIVAHVDDQRIFPWIKAKDFQRCTCIELGWLNDNMHRTKLRLNDQDQYSSTQSFVFINYYKIIPKNYCIN